MFEQLILKPMSSFLIIIHSSTSLFMENIVFAVDARSLHFYISSLLSSFVGRPFILRNKNVSTQNSGQQQPELSIVFICEVSEPNSESGH